MDPVKHIPSDSVLYLNGVYKSFDGYKAINNLCLDIRKGELRAVIGPNGAGKSTMMDIITGKTKPDTGEVFYNSDIDLTQYDETAIANMGIGRKFQKPTVIESLSVFENLELALSGSRGVFKALWHQLTGQQQNRIDEILALIDLAEREHELAGNLSHGQKQWLEIGMLMIQEPQVMLVDEPAAGMTDAETAKTAELLKEIAKTRSVVVVEHDMDFIRALNTKVTVLHEGHVLAEGTLDQVSHNQSVIEVYLGR